MNRKGRILACGLSLALSFGLLGGCDRGTGEYYTESVHSEKQNVLPQQEDGSGINGYYTLKGAVLNMVGMGIAEDVFRVGSYSGDLEADLKTIIQEITTVEPIGIYGVSSITVDQTRILTYRELSVSIQYKCEPSLLRTITEVRSDYDLHSRVETMLTTMGEQYVFQIGNGDQLAGKIQQEIYTAWMNCGADAPGLDYVTAEFYPEGKDKAILEIRPQYLEEIETQQARAQQIAARAGETAALITGESAGEKLQAAAQWLQENVVYDKSAQRVVNETGGEQRKGTRYTAYGALVNGEAAQSGFVLAASAMLDELDIVHEIVCGTVGEDIYAWISFTEAGQDYVFDVTALQNGREAVLYTAEEAAAIFVPWF